MRAFENLLNPTDETSGGAVRSTIASEPDDPADRAAPADPTMAMDGDQGVSKDDVSVIAKILGKDEETVGRAIRLVMYNKRTKIKLKEIPNGTTASRNILNWVGRPEWDKVLKYMEKGGMNGAVMQYFPRRGNRRQVTGRPRKKS